MFRWLRSSSSTRSRAPARFRPRIEALEDRALLAISEPLTIANSGANEFQSATASGASDGSRIVAWRENSDIHAQRLDYRGAALGSEIVVSASPDPEGLLDVAMNSAGNFVVAWTRSFNNRFDVRFALFNRFGGLIIDGPVASSPGLSEFSPSVGIDAEGGFVVSYMVSGGGSYDIHARRFTTTGAPKGGTIVVAGDPDFNERNSRLDCNAAGAFAITYALEVSATAHEIVFKRLLTQWKIAENCPHRPH
jgi:hypothetical protein